MSAHEQVKGHSAPAPPAAQAVARLQTRLRSVNREIGRRASAGVTAAFVCECLDRGCVEAVEAPVKVFAVLASAAGLYLVRPGHDEPLRERVVRRESGFVVVERRL